MSGRPFEGVPRGVLALAGVILAAHVALAVAGDAWRTRATFDLAVIPLRYQISPADGGFSGVWDAALPLVGHAFLHGGWVHLFFNLAMLVQVGGLARLGLGSDMRFLALFFGSAAAGALAFLAVNPMSQTPMAGASGAVSGVFGAYLWTAFRAGGRTRDSLRAVGWSAAAFLLVNVGLAAVARLFEVLPIAWEAHLGGFFGGLALYPLLRRRLRAAG